MRPRSRAAYFAVAVVLVLSTYTGISRAQPLLASGADAEVTEDGLHRVDPTIMDAAWVRPDLDLTAYSKVFLMPAQIQFREVRDVSQFDRARGSVEAFPIEEIRQQQFSELWGQLFHDDVATLESYELVTDVGRDVLLVQGTLIDVISGVPPDTAAGGSSVTVMYPWAASIVLEVRDSMSDQLLARTADRRRVEGPLDATAVWARTSNMVQRWSRLLCERLEELTALNAP